MNTKTFAALAALVGLSSAVFAQSFEAQVADGSVEISRQAKASRDDAASERAVSVQGAPTSYARTILCAKPPKDSYLPEGLRFYTALDGRSTKPHRDDTASQLNDYRGSYLKDGKFHYDVWSCDTQDYWFTFDAESLLKTSPSDKHRPVKGHARIETRGHLDWEGELDCVANF
jgi:hypothetical protein